MVPEPLCSQFGEAIKTIDLIGGVPTGVMGAKAVLDEVVGEEICMVVAGVCASEEGWDLSSG
jgi:hypothetical protein